MLLLRAKLSDEEQVSDPELPAIATVPLHNIIYLFIYLFVYLFIYLFIKAINIMINI